MLLVLLLLVLTCAGAALAAVVRDGHGLRPPPASSPAQERMRSWPR